MPGTVTAFSTDSSHQPRAAPKTNSSTLPISHHLSNSDMPNTTQPKQHHSGPMPDKAQSGSQLKLKKPFSKKAHRIIAKKTAKLIKRRNDLDRDILIAAEKQNPAVSDWLPRDKLLRNRERMERREQYHLRKRTKKLAELERLYRWDPSSARAYDYDQVRKLLWRFKRNLGPLLDEYTKRADQEYHGNDDTSSEGSESDSDSDAGKSDASGSEDDNGQSSRDTVTAKSPSLNGHKGRSQANGHSQDAATSEVCADAAPKVQMGGGKRKREEDSLTPSKKVRFELAEDIQCDHEDARKKKKKSKKDKKGKKNRQSSEQEPQINGK
ncbi:hypothetical protein F5Y03DRAFT_117628 [Xylaria venustula]|nr:hypothetical protein F5Y03DRAFT_117628 [Xylaria venustula]